jgi:hypothetical protein
MARQKFLPFNIMKVYANFFKENKIECKVDYNRVNKGIRKEKKYMKT